VHSERDIPAERTGRLRRLVQLRGVLSVRAAQAELGVSEMTVRRDFLALEEAGLVQRTRGGVILTRRVSFENRFGDREALQVEAKTAIAKLATGLVEPNATVFIGAGTTCELFAREVRDHVTLTVITNSVRVVLEALTAHDGMKVISTGGVVRGDNKDLIGHAAELGISRYRAQQAFIPVAGLCEDGLFSDSSDEDAVTRVMMDNAAEVVVLADHTKLGKVSFVRIAELGEVGTLVTDLTPPTSQLSWLSAAGVRVMAADALAENAEGPSRSIPASGGADEI
jgi:DeoR family transcriptional regulator, fructose operon transcriptional repressor